MKALGRKLLEAAKESDSTLAKMIVDGKYRPAPEGIETRKTSTHPRRRNRKRNRGRFQKKFTPRSNQPEKVGARSRGIEAKPERIEAKPEVVEAKPERIEVTPQS